MRRVVAAAVALTLLPASVAHASSERLATRPQRIVVKHGDTLSALFSETPGGWSRAAFVNDLDSPDLITPGMVLTIPKKDGRRFVAPRVSVSASRSTRAETASYGSGACGGSLPTCAILDCESGGDIRAENPTSSASGKWQVLDSTWDGYAGYARASDAPEAVQDEFARRLWNGGAGRSQWAC